MFSFIARRAATGIAFSLLTCGMPGMVLAETIRIGGTGAGLGTMTQLGDAFVKTHPAHSVKVLPSLGTSGGLKALQGGALDIALTARDMKAEEKGAGLSATRYGSTAFVFVSHAKAPPLSLTKKSIAAIYAAAPGKWPNGQPMRVILRPQQDIDTRMLKTLSPEIDAALSAAHARNGMTIAVTDTDSADQIEKVPYSFGTSTLALVLAEKRNVNLLPVDGVLPSVQTLSDGSYPYAKDMYVVTTATPSSGTTQFIEFIRSPKGSEILKKTGHKLNQP